MYNLNYYLQTERFKVNLFNYQDPRNLISSRYSPPPAIKILECEEDVNGEWIPRQFLEHDKK